MSAAKLILKPVTDFVPGLDIDKLGTLRTGGHPQQFDIDGSSTAASFQRLSKVRDAMDAIGSGEGDLTKRLPVIGQDEVAQIARSFNTFIEKLTQVIRQIREISESVRLAANEIATGNAALSSRTEAAAASLQQTAASMEEITSTVTQAANAAKQADDTAVLASNVASRGGAVISEVVTTMAQIERASVKIADIIGVIDGIAFQTNILALNAAVEAARAGEQGRGFAVVAGEVRGLAQRSAQAAKEIKVLVESTVSSVNSGSGQVRQAGETMTDIVSNVANVTTIITEITNASGEQTRGIQEVNRSVSQLDDMVQQNAALVEQASAAAHSLAERAQALRTQWLPSTSTMKGILFRRDCFAPSELASAGTDSPHVPTEGAPAHGVPTQRRAHARRAQ